MKVYVTHVYNAAAQLHDYYVHGTVEGALPQAATDIVQGRFEEAEADFLELETRRVIATATVEAGSGRRQMRCDMWFAYIDEMQVLP